MTRPNLRTKLLLFAATCLCAAAPADMDWKQGRLGRLSPTIGTYRYDAVLYDPAVMNALHDLLGGTEQRLLLQNFRTVEPIAFSGTALILRGMGARPGEQAILAVKLADGSIEAAILDAGNVTLFTQQATSGGVAAEIADTARRWARATHTDVAIRRPSDNHAKRRAE